MMNDPAVERFKVWPTQLDRDQFSAIMSAGSRQAVITRFPLQYRPRARKPDPRPRMVEAYVYFYDQLTAYFIGANGDTPLCSESRIGERLQECFQALKNSLRVVAIDLEHDDDAQVIFETLNARGEPLLPADLLRNYIFLRASRRNEPSESLYSLYWKRFDDEFWREEIKQGRLMRPRSDLFMQHFLASRLNVDIPIKHLFVEYKNWIERYHPFSTVEDELRCLAINGANFRRLVAPTADDVLYPLSRLLDTFDVRTTYPLLLAMLAADLSDDQWREISDILESYIVRRAICGWTTKNYNRIFLTLTKNLRSEGFTPDALRRHLADQKGESVEWPSNETFKEKWMTQSAYHVLNTPKLVHLFARLNSTHLNARMEDIEIRGPLTIEHVLPQNWIAHWPLPGGEKGCSYDELAFASPNDRRAVATRARNLAVQTLGNLTIVTQPLNSAASNGNWRHKREELGNSLLPINHQFRHIEVWDETAIQHRSEELFDRALKLWSRPMTGSVLGVGA